VSPIRTLFGHVVGLQSTNEALLRSPLQGFFSGSSARQAILPSSDKAQSGAQTAPERGGEEENMKSIKKIAVVGAIVAATTIGAMVPAEALSVSYRSGVPGIVNVPYTITGHPGNSPWIGIDPTFVRRSSSYPTANQVVMVTYRVYELVGATWQYQASLSGINLTLLVPGSPGAYVGGWATIASHWGGPYAVDIKFDWVTTSGTLIGTKVVDYNLQSDYQCAPNDPGTFSICLTGQVAGSGYLRF
jgi:hypothetical protein